MLTCSRLSLFFFFLFIKRRLQPGAAYLEVNEDGGIAVRLGTGLKRDVTAKNRRIARNLANFPFEDLHKAIKERKAIREMREQCASPSWPHRKKRFRRRR
jgi:hypothetical protein